MKKASGTAPRRLILAAATLALAACGGGGSGSSSGGGSGGQNNNVSMSVTPQSVAVSATTAQPGPTASVQVTFSGMTQNQQVYLTGTLTKHGIQSIQDASGSSPISVTIQFQTPASLGAGVYTDTINLEGCYDQACTQQVTGSPVSVQVQFTVTDTTVKLTSLNPTSAIASGAPFTLTVNGSNFSQGAYVTWNGAGRTTTYVSATQLTAQIATADIATAGNAAVAVNDPTNGLSNPLTFNILPAQLTLNSISPSTVAVGGSDFMLTVLGAGFTSTSKVLWNGSPRPTTLIAGGELVAQIPAADIAALGTVSITVQDSASSVGTTTAQTLTIAPVSIDAIAFQMNPAHTGAVTFASVSLPSSAAWTTDVGGTPSYALIVAGKVILTVNVGGSSQLVALDQATGAIAWGPVALGGLSNAAYDSGRVFVLSSAFGNAATMLAYDVQTGQRQWSTLLYGQYAFSSGPTAANGIVYTGGAGSGGTLYAVDQSNGNIVWTQEVANGDNSTPAVTADGVYVTYPCTTYDFRPATGDSIWYNNTGCEGGGGATPVVANGVVYSPNLVVGNSGSAFNAENGTNLGPYSADTPPAFTGSNGFYLQNGTLRSITNSNSTVNWSFAGDGQLAGSPVVVNNYVFIASSSGNVYALDMTSGLQDWQVTLPNAIAPQTGGLQYSGLAAGDGLLVVPNGTKVTTYVLSTNP